MGQFRFLVSRPERLPADALERVLFTGIEGIPFRSRAVWLEPGDEGSATFVLHREASESGSLSFPWPLPGHGELMLSTTSLMERAQPYDLAIELARGLVNRVRNQRADWEMAGLLVPDQFKEWLCRATDAFLDLAGCGDGAKADAADEVLRLGLQAGDLLVSSYCQQALAARHQQVGQLPTLMASQLCPRAMSEECSRRFLPAINSAAVPIRWRDVEGTAGKLEWQAIDEQIQWCRTHGLRIIGGPLLELHRPQIPDWLYLWEEDFEQIQTYVQQFIRSAVARYQGKVQIWNCAARMNVRGRLNLSEEEKLRLVVQAIETVRLLDPNTPLIVSFDQPWGEYLARDSLELEPLHFADSLVRADLGIAGLGLEMHLGYWPGGSLPRELLEISRMLDRWSMLSLPLVVFLTIPGEGAASAADTDFRPLPTLGDMTAQRQQQMADQVARLLLSKQFVQAVVWKQLSDDGAEYAGGGLLDADYQSKPALDSLAAIRQEHLM